MDIKDAMKTTVNAATSRTSSTYAATDLIQLYDNSGNPSYKISKSDLMSSVQASLGSLLNAGSDQTTVAKVPTLNGNTLGASTVATLASVLGAPTNIQNTSLSSKLTSGIYFSSGASDRPAPNDGILQVFAVGTASITQIYWCANPVNGVFIRNTLDQGVSWRGWYKINTDAIG